MRIATFFGAGADGSAKAGAGELSMAQAIAGSATAYRFACKDIALLQFERKAGEWRCEDCNWTLVRSGAQPPQEGLSRHPEPAAIDAGADAKAPLEGPPKHVIATETDR